MFLLWDSDGDHVGPRADLGRFPGWVARPAAIVDNLDRNRRAVTTEPVLGKRRGTHNTTRDYTFAELAELFRCLAR